MREIAFEVGLVAESNHLPHHRSDATRLVPPEKKHRQKALVLSCASPPHGYVPNRTVAVSPCLKTSSTGERFSGKRFGESLPSVELHSLTERSSYQFRSCPIHIPSPAGSGTSATGFY